MSEITEQMKQWVREQREIEKLEQKEVKQENITPISVNGVVYTPVVSKASPTLTDLAIKVIVYVSLWTICMAGVLMWINR